MSKQLKRILSLMLVLAMILSVMPTVFAEGSRISGEANAATPISERSNRIVEEDVFAAIAELEVEAAHPMGGQSRMTEADYIKLVPQVKTVIENSTDLAFYILLDANVSTVQGTAFGDDDCIRLSYATSEDKLKEACRRIKVAVEALK